MSWLVWLMVGCTTVLILGSMLYFIVLASGHLHGQSKHAEPDESSALQLTPRARQSWGTWRIIRIHEMDSVVFSLSEDGNHVAELMEDTLHLKVLTPHYGFEHVHTWHNVGNPERFVVSNSGTHVVTATANSIHMLTVKGEPIEIPLSEGTTIMKLLYRDDNLCYSTHDSESNQGSFTMVDQRGNIMQTIQGGPLFASDFAIRGEWLALTNSAQTEVLRFLWNAEKRRFETYDTLLYVDAEETSMFPHGVAVDTVGNVVVTDPTRSRDELCEIGAIRVGSEWLYNHEPEAYQYFGNGVVLRGYHMMVTDRKGTVWSYDRCNEDNQWDPMQKLNGTMVGWKHDGANQYLWLRQEDQLVCYERVMAST